MPHAPDPPAAFAFRVSIGTAPDGASALFHEVRGLDAEITTETLPLGGETTYSYARPSAVSSTLVLQRGVLALTSPLLRWCTTTLNAPLGAPITAQTVRVSLVSDTGAPVFTWVFEKAVPVALDVGQTQSMTKDVLVERIEITFSRRTRER
ncbi:MAG: phage tail protein [Gemmatimonadaceae bacterium]|nr:phage tail protein [Gemmatimonadaceae bacterium]